MLKTFRENAVDRMPRLPDPAAARAALGALLQFLLLAALAFALSRATVVRLSPMAALAPFAMALFAAGIVAGKNAAALLTGCHRPRERKTFELTDLGLISFEDPGNRDAVVFQFVNQSFVNDILYLLRTIRKHFGTEDIFVAVHGESRDAVGFPEDQTTAAVVVLHDRSSHIQRVFHAALPEGRSVCFVGIVAEDADADLAVFT